MRTPIGRQGLLLLAAIAALVGCAEENRPAPARARPVAKVEHPNPTAAVRPVPVVAPLRLAASSRTVTSSPVPEARPEVVDYSTGYPPPVIEGYAGFGCAVPGPGVRARAWEDVRIRRIEHAIENARKLITHPDLQEELENEVVRPLEETRSRLKER
jgi:hypothetical protein